MAARGPSSYGVKLVRGPFVRLEPHELACSDEDDLRALGPTLEKPLAADLFCGAGGLSLGLSNAGFEVVLAVDHDDEALATHRAHHPGLSINWDLGDEEVVERVGRLIRDLEISVVAGGPPCQPFSRAGRSMMRDLVRTGRRPQHDRRRDLWESFLGVIEESLPPAVIMENVPDMALDRGMVILRTMIERLESLGYSVEERVVETLRYGVPQFRQRLILVALKGGVDFRWPDECEERVTVRAAIDDLPPVEGGWRPDNGDGDDPVATGWMPYSEPRSSFQKAMREGVPPRERQRLYDHITRPVREDDAIAFASMSHDTRYSDLDDSLKRYRDDIFDDKYKRLNWDDVSRTITAHIAKDGYWYIHPEEDRTLTVREAARLQTFPDWFRFAGPPSAAFRQIGNAVPVRLGEVIGRAVLTSIERGERARISTSMVAEELADWFDTGETRYVPWLRAENRWQVIQADLLWSRMAPSEAYEGWRTVELLLTPEKTLECLELLRIRAARWDRLDRVEQLAETASWFVENPDLLALDRTAADLASAPNVGPSTADLACRVVPGDSDDPVIAGFGVLRVVARFQGLPVDQQNRLTDGRLAIARMIAHDEHMGRAHLALIELAAGVCSPRRPQCGICPLEPWCHEARRANVQGALGFTSPER
jgi:DNA (cytosine-5)-methyltransferase 1